MSMKAAGRTASADRPQDDLMFPALGARGVTGLLAVLAGGMSLLLSFSSLTWFADPMPEGGTAFIPFSSLGRSGFIGMENGFTRPYFGWIAVVAAIACFALGVAANISPRFRPALRLTGALLGVAAIAATFAAVPVTSYRGYSKWLNVHDIGFSSAVVGFALCAIGAALAHNWPKSQE